MCGALVLLVRSTLGSPESHNGRSSSQRGTPFGSLLANSFKVDHHHHHNHHHHHQQYAPHILEELYKHLSCWSDPLQALQGVTTDGHPSNEELLSELFWQIL